jgi:hypothetical protein
MNKKRILISLTVAVALLGILIVPACNDDFMQRYPLAGINDGTYFKTPNDLRLFVNPLYPNLSALNKYRDDNSSDNQVPNTRDGITWNEYTLPVTGGGWAKGDWVNIRTCNYFLQRWQGVGAVDQLSAEQQVEVRQYLGEILFFKSLFYYEKVARFGDVPWLDSDLQTNSDELLAPRTSRKIVMDSVCANLDRAARYMREDMVQDRLSRYAALALKSRVCLFEGTFRKYHALGDHENMLKQAAAAAWEVMQSGKFKLYSTKTEASTADEAAAAAAVDYHTLFNMEYDGVKASGEAIFYTNHIFGINQHNRPREVVECNSGMSRDFAEAFLCTDGKPIGVSELYKGDDEGAVYLDEFVNRDPRMKQTIYTSDQVFLAPAEHQPSPVFNNMVTTGYQLWKMTTANAKDREPTNSEISDMPFRYAEVLLNYAEAKAELGECNLTVLNQTINLLRDRVGMPPMTETPTTDPNWPAWEVAPDNVPLINEIRRERRIELACEGFRWNDIRRWKAGKLLNNAKTYQGAIHPETGKFYEVYVGFTRTWNDKCYLYPIPTGEFVLNPNLGNNNPGW